MEKGVVKRPGHGECALTLPCLRDMVACQTGMGKTLQLYALIQDQVNRQAEGQYGAIVVLVPPSITGNWAETLQRYFSLSRLLCTMGATQQQMGSSGRKLVCCRKMCQAMPTEE